MVKDIHESAFFISILKIMTKSRSTQLSMIFFLSKNVRCHQLKFMSRKNSLLGLSEPEKETEFSLYFYTNELKISYSAELRMKRIL